MSLVGRRRPYSDTLSSYSNLAASGRADLVGYVCPFDSSQCGNDCSTALLRLPWVMLCCDIHPSSPLLPDLKLAAELEVVQSMDDPLRTQRRFQPRQWRVVAE